ncbi:MAG: methylmalonyl Co-A mutase-associated GTPase MeaB [Kordiimonadaceae bacterium]|jgi:LAO/AO transport system kinase|nr:methylmalonyl Co-A mutase-associated GTPase MeaB [Kordiimonadaceae bacterium]MBT6032597.1 methylmalonyl Co-A mutase-associated GTPase MeaB [Kordiimonadaceae bacterium]
MDQYSAMINALRNGDIRALSRAITLAENDVPLSDQLVNHKNGSNVVGITGAPGVGKSTLINAYINQLRADGKTVAVLCVDPSSPTSGGAFLGDRLRMSEHANDPGVFIRSLSARNHLGGLCKNIENIIKVIKFTNAWDTIILETVGAGQSEVEVAKIANCKIVVLVPGYGDEMQAMKAGILEIADILIINKSDMPGAHHSAKELKAMLRLRPKSDWDVPVLMSTATENEGICELIETVERFKVSTH